MNSLERGGRLKIAIIGSELLHVIAGANDFFRNQIKALALRPDTELFFICPPREDETLYSYYLEAAPKMIRLPYNTDPPTLETLRKAHGIDCFLPSIYILPTSLPYITYWPDCQHRHLPEYFDEASSAVRDERIAGLLATGKPMIVNSLDAKNDMIKFYDADPNQIFNLPLAPIIEFDHLVPRPELAAKYEPIEPYFIVCNQFWIHKNLGVVIEAADLVRSRGIECNIIFTGKMEEPRFPGYPQSIVNMVAERSLESQVRFLGHLPKRDQLELMKRAKAAIQPTLFEGGPGGGAVYDAQCLGVRAIVSDIPVNRELPYDDPTRGISYFPPKDAHALADRIAEVISTPWQYPTVEDCFQMSKKSVAVTSERLYEAVEAVIAGMKVEVT